MLNLYDEHKETGNDLEEMDIMSDTMNEDLYNMLHDYVISIVEENSNEIWEELCNEFGKDMASYLYNSENIINKYYGVKNAADEANFNHDYYDLLHVMTNLIMNEYVNEQGGWFDKIADEYYLAVENKYYDLVADEE